MQPKSALSAPALDDNRPITRLVLPSISKSIYERNLLMATILAEAWNVAIELVHVSPSITSEDEDVNHLYELMTSRHPDFDVRATHLQGDDPAVAVANHVGPGSLVVLSTEHIQAWQVKGSVAEGLLEHVGHPVLLIGPNVSIQSLRDTGVGGDVVVGLDGSAAAEAGVAPALELAKSLGHRLWLLRIVHEPEPGEGPHPEIATQLQALADACNDQISTRWEIIHDNDPTEALERFAERQEAAFIVVSHRKRTSPDRPTMASITAGLAATSARSVLALVAPDVPAVEAG